MPRLPAGVAPTSVLRLAGLIVLAGLAPVLATAQNVTGTIAGTISDPSGAGVAGARVALTHVATGLVRALAADDRGDYTAPLLAPGTYTLTAEAPGFRLTSIAGVQLALDQRLRIDLTLEIGALADTVTVQAANLLVQRDSAELSATLGEAQVQALPLSGRNFVQLARTGAWQVTDAGIVFVVTTAALGGTSREPDALAVHDFAERRVRKLGELTFRATESPVDRLLAVSRDGRWALASNVDRWDRDILVADGVP